MNSHIAITMYRSIIRKSRNHIDISKGILTKNDTNLINVVYLDRYYIEKHDVEQSVLGPYENKQMNAVSWIKSQIRERSPTKNNIDILFEVHRDINEILYTTQYSDNITEEY